MRVMTIRDSSNGVAKNFDRRFRHVGVIVGRASFSKIFQDPELLFACLDVLLRFDSRQSAEMLKLSVGTRTATVKDRLVGLNSHPA